jgi:hypothetical protein
MNFTEKNEEEEKKEKKENHIICTAAMIRMPSIMTREDKATLSGQFKNWNADSSHSSVALRCSIKRPRS